MAATHLQANELHKADSVDCKLAGNDFNQISSTNVKISATVLKSFGLKLDEETKDFEYKKTDSDEAEFEGNYEALSPVLVGDRVVYLEAVISKEKDGKQKLVSVSGTITDEDGKIQSQKICKAGKVN